MISEEIVMFEEIVALLDDSEVGMSISELADKSSASMAEVNVILAFLFGRGDIGFRQTDGVKAFYLLGECGEELISQKS